MHDERLVLSTHTLVLLAFPARWGASEKWLALARATEVRFRRKVDVEQKSNPRRRLVRPALLAKGAGNLRTKPADGAARRYRPPPGDKTACLWGG